MNIEDRKKISQEKKLAQAKFQGRIEDDRNPCLKEQKLSFKCLNDNNYDSEACEKFFDNYKICKEFWGQIQRDRRFRGIVPELPPPQEREKIREEFIKSRLSTK